MIEEVWKTTRTSVNQLENVRKLTPDHFKKNPHSRMRVFLSGQILTQSVLTMLKDYCGDNKKRLEEYSSLMLMIERFDTVIDIWNHYRDRTFRREPEGEEQYDKLEGMEHLMHFMKQGERYESINGVGHRYIVYLMNTLAILKDWKDESKAAKNEDIFIPVTLYESFAWLVYGIMGVASQIPDNCKMNQRHGGTDDNENEFSYLRHANPNPTGDNVRKSTAKASGFRAADFAVGLRSNTSGDNHVNIKALSQPLKRKVRNDANELERKKQKRK